MAEAESLDAADADGSDEDAGVGTAESTGAAGTDWLVAALDDPPTAWSG